MFTRCAVDNDDETSVIPWLSVRNRFVQFCANIRHDNLSPCDEDAYSESSLVCDRGDRLYTILEVGDFPPGAIQLDRSVVVFSRLRGGRLYLEELFLFDRSF